jgi:hypothetical protein
MEAFTSVCIGIGLAAACGFRVFVPLLIMSFASLSGHLTLSPGFEWIGTYPALSTFLVATGLEVAGYYIPWIDNILDAVATPAAVTAGTIIMASAVSGMSPLLQWSLAVVVGGGAAGTVQIATSTLRAASSLTTGGLGNPLISTMEMGGSISLSTLAVALPALAGLAVMGGLLFAAYKLFGKLAHKKEIKQCG